jgi:serine/threonine protein kinase
MWRPGDRIRNYRILAHLKTGGMATLYLARREGAAGFYKPVAIKVIHHQYARDENFIRMFLNEAMLSSRMQDPNVVKIDELGEVDGTYFIAMEYIPGRSLNEACRSLVRLGRRISIAVAVSVAMRVADGLHAAHEARDDNGILLDVVHRDVSPSNIILAHSGHIKLIDFGIARARNSIEQTASGVIKGKHQYMAPEQALGRTVDRRADVFSLAVVLWELLTMKPLFTVNSTEELLARLRQGPVAPPSVWTPDVPAELDEAIVTALALDPQERPYTARLFKEQIVGAVPEAMGIDAFVLAKEMDALLAATSTTGEARLVIDNGPQRGAEFRIRAEPGEWIVGRGSGVDWTLNDVDASREHFKLHRFDQGVLIEDLNSKNGLSVNGRAVRMIQLHNGDIIRVGSTFMRYEDIPCVVKAVPVRDASVDGETAK